MKKYLVITYVREESISQTAKAYELSTAKAIARHRNHLAKINHRKYVSYEIEPEVVKKGWRI